MTGTGSVFAINHNADNALITLRYRLQDADIQMAEEPFEAGGEKFTRGSFIIRNVPQADLDGGRQGVRRAGARARQPRRPCKTHPARAARVALMHTWQSTQTEGWWRRRSTSTGFRTTTSARRTWRGRRTCARSTT